MFFACLMLAFIVAPAASLHVGMAALRTARVAAPATMSHCNIYPIFTLKDYAAAKPFMDECVAATDKEPGCLYYGWTVSQDRTKLFCRETYVDGKAAAYHLKTAGPIVGKMLECGCVELNSVGVMGTEADLADVKEEGDKLGCEYWTVWDSFSNFQKSDAKESSTNSDYPASLHAH